MLARHPIEARDVNLADVRDPVKQTVRLAAPRLWSLSFMGRKSLGPPSGKHRIQHERGAPGSREENPLGEFIHCDLGHRNLGDVLEVSLASEANVRLLDPMNYDSYRQGQEYRFHGVLADQSPLHLRIPRSGPWHAVVDLQGLRGTVLAEFRVIRLSAPSSPPPRNPWHAPSLPGPHQTGSLGLSSANPVLGSWR